MPLVDYDSESDQDAPDMAVATVTQNAVTSSAKKRKQPLPSLPKTYESGVAPRDDPAFHQGRKRTRPYVDGDYDTHIYLSLELPRRLIQEIKALEKDVRDRCPGLELHSFLDRGRELHVSLTHPFPLRRHQIAPFRSRLTQCLATELSDGRSGMSLSLGGSVKVYYNGKRYGGEGHGGRAFLALQVTSGFREVNTLVERVMHPLLTEIHRPLYHTNPEYHASFAWCLTGTDKQLPSGTAQSQAISPGADAVINHMPGNTSQPLLEPISEDVVADLHKAFERRILDAMPPTGWLVTELFLKTGKDITRIAL